MSKLSASEHSKTEVPPEDDDMHKKPSLIVDTSKDSNTTIEPQPSQNTGSQRMPPTNNSKATIDTWHEHGSQRPEDLRRAQYLTSNYSNNKEERDENDDMKKPKKRFESPPTCWTTTSWVLTWWAPPFMLKTFGKTQTQQKPLTA